MFEILPYIIEGEIIEVKKHNKKMGPFVRYVCKGMLPNGTEIILPDVKEVTLFGGISDYFIRRARATKDAPEGIPGSLDVEELDATVGDRVYIAFIGGNILNPVIIGHAQHPNQTDEIKNLDDEPSAVLQYLGIRIEINKDGEIRFIRKGAPKVKFAPKMGGLLGAAAEALGELSSLAGGSAIKGNNNDALEPADDEEVTLWEILKDGIFRIRDAEGQMIEIDRKKQRIYISNNDLKSTEDAGGGPLSGGLKMAENATDAEYVLLDKKKELVLINARTTAQIYSFDKRKDVTEGKHTHKVGDNSEWSIGGDEVVKIDGDQVNKIEGDQINKIGGDKKDTVSGDAKQAANGTWTIDAGGAVLKLGSGKVGLGGPAAELLDLFDQLMDQLNNLLTAMQTETHTGNLGYPTSPPMNAANYASAQSSIATIKSLLNSIKGGI